MRDSSAEFWLLVSHDLQTEKNANGSARITNSCMVFMCERQHPISAFIKWPTSEDGMTLSSTFSPWTASMISISMFINFAERMMESRRSDLSGKLITKIFSNCIQYQSIKSRFGEISATELTPSVLLNTFPITVTSLLAETYSIAPTSLIAFTSSITTSGGGGGNVQEVVACVRRSRF